uniref:Uncharacterized protein n=1 Tax=Meloidogyne incognita TaxID=6306 RepID=A0A914N7U0_MELIC
MGDLSTRCFYISLTHHKRRCAYLLCFAVVIILCYLFLISPDFHIGKPLKEDNFDVIFKEERRKEEAFYQINKKIWEAFETEQNATWNRFNCERIVHGDKDYLYNLQNKIITYKDNPNLSLKCEDIYERNHFLNITRSEDEKKFPLAFARIVNQDYRFLEAELATNYHPQNWYCFAVDSKADDSFYEKILALASCFKNIIIPRSRYPVDSGGHGMGNAHLSCFKELIKKERKWEYLVTLQNHDIQIKTNEEMVQIFKWLDGACDAGYDFQSEAKRDRLDGLNRKFNWTFESLKIFKDASLNKRFNEQGLPLKLSLASGNIQASLARPFVEFIVNKLDLTKMLDQLDNWEYAGDEFFIQTLLASDDLKAPNAFTHKCIDQKINVPYVTRYNIWEFEHKDKCYSNNFRHYSCVFGIDDLWHNFHNLKYLFVNKMMPKYDFGAIICWHEEMRRRNILESRLKKLNSTIYQNWPQASFFF